MAEKQITRRLKIFINGEEIDNTVSNISKKLAEFRTKANRAVEGTDKWKEYNSTVAKLEVELDDARKAQRAFREDTKLTEKGIKDSERELAKFTGSFNDLIQGYRSGDILQIKEGWQGVRNGIRGATRAALAFIATPVGAAITVLVGVGAAAKAWFDYNTQVVEALKNTRAITGLTGAAADEARIRAESIAETFDTDFGKNLETAKSLVTQFKISYAEAFDVIEERLVRGQTKNEEFFDSLGEYGPFFEQARFNADEFGRVIAAGYDLGFYKDKLPDAIKEATLSLTEQTKTQRDALENAFGKEFTDTIFNGIKNGSISVKEALALIGEETEKQGLNVQQNAQLTADIFKGAGEDAGGALKIFEAINVALNEQQRELTESEQLLQDQNQATAELKRVSSALFATGDEGFGLIIDKAKLLGTQILVDILKKGVDFINFFIELNNKSTVFSGIIATLGELGSAQMKILVTAWENLGNIVGGVGDIITGVFTFDREKIQQGFTRQAAAAVKFYDDIKNKAVDSADKIKAAFRGENQLEKITLGAFSGDSGEGGTTGQNFRTGGGGGGDGQLTADDQKVLDSRKKLREFLKQIEQEEEIQKELKKIEEDARAEEEEILRLEKKFEKMREEAGLTNEVAEELSEEEKTLLAQLEDAKEFELQQVRDKYAKIRSEKKKKDDEKLTKQEEEFKKKLIQSEQNLQRARVQILNAGISTIQGFFDKSSSIYKALFAFEKALAINEVITASSAAIAKAKAADAAVPAVIPPGIPNPFKPLSIASTAKNILSAKLTAAAQISRIAGTAIQGFEDGGETFPGPSSGGVDGRGGRYAILHPNEFVIPRPVRRDPVVQALEGYVKRKIGEDGPPPEPATPDGPLSSPAPILYDEETKEIMRLLLEKLEEPLKVTFTLQDEIKRQELEDKLEATINEAKGN